MFKYAALALLAVSALALPTEESFIPGRIPGPNEIVGGKEVTPFKYDFIVSLQQNKRHFCGGTILPNNFMMTAAHCSTGFVNNLKSLTVSVHRHDLRNTVASEKGCEYTVSKINVHPGYSGRGDYSNDVAVWKIVPLPCEFEPTVLPLEFDSAGSVYSAPGHNLTASGWGVLSSGSSRVSPVLMEVSIPITTAEVCIKAYGKTQVDESMICAGVPQGGIDTCQGDSGSPVFAMTPSGSVVLIGATSWGQGCASPGYPGVYARISYLRSWIEGIISGKTN